MIRLSSTYINAAATRVANVAMDIIVRLAILEGAAGVVPGQWQRGTPMQLAKTLSGIPQVFPDIHPSWVSTRDMGIYSAIITTARGILGTEEAEELAMDIVTGATRGSGVVGGQLYDVGQKLRNHIEAGGDLGRAKGFLRIHTKHRALGLSQRRREVSLTRETDEGVDEQIDISSGKGPDFQNIMVEFLDSPAGQRAKAALRRALQSEFEKSPASAQILDVWLDDPSLTATEIARIVGNIYLALPIGGGKYQQVDPEWVKRNIRTQEDLRRWQHENPKGMVSATRTSKVLRDIWSLAQTFFSQSQGQRLLREVHYTEEMGGLGYGQRMATNHASLVRLANWLLTIRS